MTYADGEESVKQIEAVAADTADTIAPVTNAALAPDGDGVRVSFSAVDTGGARLAGTEYSLDGGRWTRSGQAAQPILDATEASFARWRQAPDGSFSRLADGTIESVGGLGMLWYPVASYGDFSVKLKFRDARTDGGASNSGVFVRFPDPRRATLPACGAGESEAWVAIYCGQEIQIYDGTTGETQKTGSIYNFDPLTLEQAKPVPAGEWSDYEIRVVGQRYTISRNGVVINTFDNEVPRASSRDGDPPTQDRQFAYGYLGVQNHGGQDKIQIKDVTVQPLGGSGAFTVDEPGTHTVAFRSADTAGNVEAERTVTFTVGGAAPQPPSGSPPGSTPPATPPSGTQPGAAFGVRGVKRLDGHGLRFSVICEATGTGRAAVKITRGARKRLELGSVTLASRTVRCTQGQPVTVTLKPSRGAARRARAVKRLAAVLELRMRPAGGDRLQVLQRDVTLRR